QPGEHVGAHDTTDAMDAHGIAHGHFEPHESPRSMTLPLVVLAAFSIFVGLIGIPHALSFGANINAFERWLDPVIVDVHRESAPATGHAAAEAAPGARSTPSGGTETHGLAEAHGEAAHEATDPTEYVLMLFSVAIAVGGIYLGRLFYEKRPELPKQWADRLRPLYTLSFNKWYWDYLLDVKGVEAGKAINDALWRVDSDVVDGSVNGAGGMTRFWARVSGLWDKYAVDGAVNATGWITKAGSIILRTLQTG